MSPSTNHLLTGNLASKSSSPVHESFILISSKVYSFILGKHLIVTNLRLKKWNTNRATYSVFAVAGIRNQFVCASYKDSVLIAQQSAFLCNCSISTIVFAGARRKHEHSAPLGLCCEKQIERGYFEWVFLID